MGILLNRLLFDSNGTLPSSKGLRGSERQEKYTISGDKAGRESSASSVGSLV